MRQPVNNVRREWLFEVGWERILTPQGDDVEQTLSEIGSCHGHTTIFKTSALKSSPFSEPLPSVLHRVKHFEHYDAKREHVNFRRYRLAR